MLLSEAIRREAHDRVQLLSDLGPSHLRQSEAEQHPGDLVLQVLQGHLSQEFKGRSQISGQEA